MNSDYIIDSLEQNIIVFHDLLKNVPDEIIRWKPSEEKWNLLEIVCHLYDEERDDFRIRLKHVLETPDKPLPSIDPTGWVLSRKYASKNFLETLTDFEYERKISVAWLRSLQHPSWDNFYAHPKLGHLSAKLFLSNWLAHDYLHFRQITKLKFDYLAQTSGEGLGYAGSW